MNFNKFKTNSQFFKISYFIRNNTMNDTKSYKNNHVYIPIV